MPPLVRMPKQLACITPLHCRFGEKKAPAVPICTSHRSRHGAERPQQNTSQQTQPPAEPLSNSWSENMNHKHLTLYLGPKL